MGVESLFVQKLGKEGACFMRYVGIDWADKEHKVCVIVVDEGGEVISSASIPHTQEGVLKLLAILRGIADPDPGPDPKGVLIALGTNKGLLVDSLLIHGYQVYGLNPKVVDRYVRRLELVLEKIKGYEEEIRRLLNEHPDSEPFLSLPGAGEILAARMFAEIGDRDNPYPYPYSHRRRALQELRCLAGTAPVTLTSGRLYHRVRFRRACNKELRDALQLLAFLSISRSSWAREYYDRKRGQGKAHHELLRMLADSWVKIIFALRRDGRCYDEGYHLRMREEHKARGLAALSPS